MQLYLIALCTLPDDDSKCLFDDWGAVWWLIDHLPLVLHTRLPYPPWLVEHFCFLLVNLLGICTIVMQSSDDSNSVQGCWWFVSESGSLFVWAGRVCWHAVHWLLNHIMSILEELTKINCVGCYKRNLCLLLSHDVTCNALSLFEWYY